MATLSGLYPSYPSLLSLSEKKRRGSFVNKAIKTYTPQIIKKKIVWYTSKVP